MRKKRQPGSPCCEDCPCEVTEDGLAGTLSDTWTLKTGDWGDIAVVDGYAQATGAIELWHVTPHPDNPYPADVQLRVRGVAGSVLRLVISANGDVATGDALIVELTPDTDCGTLKLYQRLDGVEDLLATIQVYGAVVDEWHDLRACYDPETEILRGGVLTAGGNWSQLSSDVDNHTDGAYAGFASGTADQSDFDSFVYRKLWYDRIITPLCPEITIEETQSYVAMPEYVFSFVNPNAFSDIIVFDPKNGDVGQPALGTVTQQGTDGAPVWESAIDTILSNADPTFDGVECELSGTLTVRIDSISPLGMWVVQQAALSNPAPQFLFAGNEWIVLDSYTDWSLQNEVQTVTVTQSSDGSYFALVYDGEQTANISTDASAATVQAALEALSTIGSGQVSVTGPAGGPWAVEFTGTLAETDVPLMTAVTDVVTCWDYDYYYYAETERITCSCCGMSCCRFESTNLHDCIVTVVSGDFEEELFPLAAESREAYDCQRSGMGFSSDAAGEWTTANIIYDVPVHVRGEFHLYDAPYTSVFRVTFDDGDYIDVWFDGTNVNIQRNGGTIYKQSSGVLFNAAAILYLDICRYHLFTSMSAYTKTAAVTSSIAFGQEVLIGLGRWQDWCCGPEGIMVRVDDQRSECVARMRRPVMSLVPSVLDV